MKSIEFKRIKLAVGDSSFEFSITEQLYDAISNQKHNGSHHGIHDGIEYFLRDLIVSEKRPPSLRQIEYIIAISKKLELKPKFNVFENVNAASDFIEKYKERYQLKIKAEKEALARYKASPEYALFQKVEYELKFHQSKLKTTEKKIDAFEMFAKGNSFLHIAKAIGVQESTIESYIKEANQAKREYADQPLSWLGLHYFFALTIKLNKHDHSVSEIRTQFAKQCIERQWYLLPWFFRE